MNMLFKNSAIKSTIIKTWLITVITLLATGCVDGKDTNGSNKSAVEVAVEDVMSAPVSLAGQDVETRENRIYLDGRESYDVDGRIVSYHWEQIAGDKVEIAQPTASATSFSVPAVDEPVEIIIQLTVIDDNGLESVDSITVTVLPRLIAPIANAGLDQAVNEGGKVTLDATESYDLDGDITKYHWKQISGPEVELNNSNIEKPYFVAPFITANTVLEFELTVSDDYLSGNDIVSITVVNINTPPLANAGADISVNEGSTVLLNGSLSSDTDGVISSYRWTQISGPAVILSGYSIASPIFTAPNVSSNKVSIFEVEVMDNSGLKDKDTVQVLIRNVNNKPTANAGTDQNQSESTLISLDGTASNDSDGTITTYFWSQVSGTVVVINNDFSATASFMSPAVNSDEILIFRVEVTDNKGEKDTDIVQVIVENINVSPVANAGPDQSVNEQTLATLNASLSNDPDGSIQTYLWSQISGTSATLSDTSIASPTFTSPSISSDETLIYELTITDDEGAQHQDNVSINVININVKPTADASFNLRVFEGVTVQLDGSASNDSDGTIASHFWTQTSGSVVVLSNINSPTPTFLAPDVSGDKIFIFSLVVNDNDSTASNPDVVIVTVMNHVEVRALNDTGLLIGGDYPSGNNGACTGETISQQDCSHGLDVSANHNEDGIAGFSYTKLDAGGNDLSSNALTWNCVRDNRTGLVWEVKKDDGGIQDKDNTYRWGGIGAQAIISNQNNEWDVLVTGTNGAALCGFNDWRVPGVRELQGLVLYSGLIPAIDTNYFPNNELNTYWSSTGRPSTTTSMYVDFSTGEVDRHNIGSGKSVRLVRGQ